MDDLTAAVTAYPDPPAVPEPSAPESPAPESPAPEATVLPPPEPSAPPAEPVAPVAPVAPADAEPFPYMAVERHVMGTCQVCAGCVQTDATSALVCAKPEPVDCILIRLLAACRSTDPSQSAQRGQLLTIASPTWCLQNAGNTGALPQ